MLCFAHGEETGVAIVVCYDRGVGRGIVSSYGQMKFVSIFVLPTKWVETMLKRHRMVLCFAHGNQSQNGSVRCAMIKKREALLSDNRFAPRLYDM